MMLHIGSEEAGSLLDESQLKSPELMDPFPSAVDLRVDAGDHAGRIQRNSVIPSITGRPTVVILDHCGCRPMLNEAASRSQSAAEVGGEFMGGISAAYDNTTGV